MMFHKASMPRPCTCACLTNYECPELFSAPCFARPPPPTHGVFRTAPFRITHAAQAFGTPPPHFRNQLTASHRNPQTHPAAGAWRRPGGMYLRRPHWRGDHSSGPGHPGRFIRRRGVKRGHHLAESPSARIADMLESPEDILWPCLNEIYVCLCWINIYDTAQMSAII